jgi:hypothetical protein
LSEIAALPFRVTVGAVLLAVVEDVGVEEAVLSEPDGVLVVDVGVLLVVRVFVVFVLEAFPKSAFIQLYELPT